MLMLYRTNKVLALIAPTLLVLFSARLVHSDENSRSGWKAPPRAAAVSNPIAADERSISIGKSLYAKECAACHGEAGLGNGPEAADLPRRPTDLCAAPIRQERDGEIFWKITEGKRPMPRFARTFNDEERWHVVNYIRSLASSNAR